MGVFTNCSVLVELKTLPIKEKRSLKAAITENGGTICFVVNKQCSLVLTSDVSSLSSNRLRSIRKYQTPVVGLDYISSCLQRGALLPMDGHRLDTSPIPAPTAGASRAPLVRAHPNPIKDLPRPKVRESQTEASEQSGDLLGKFRIYKEDDSDLPPFPERFQVAKYFIFEKSSSNSWYVLELQSLREEGGWTYRVVRYRQDEGGAKKAAVKDMLVFPTTSEEALEVFKSLKKSLLQAGLQQRWSIPALAQQLGSAPLQQLLLEEKLNTGALTPEVGAFVELLWTEATGCLGDVLTVSVATLSLNDVSRVEGLLLQAHKKLQEKKQQEAASLLNEVYDLMPFRARPPPSLQSVSQKLDVCQLIRDVLNVSEMTLRSSSPSCLGKYRALRCSVDGVPSGSKEFLDVAAQLQHSQVQIHQVLRVCRGVELQMFQADVGSIKPLLHSSRPSNFVGLLSRGLLMPRVGVEHHGIVRTDVGNLGSGIYFSDAVCTSLKYSQPSATDGSRLLLVCDVALGRCKDVRQRDPTLTEAPRGYHSVHGVRGTPGAPSEFEDDEFVVFSPEQVRLKYVVRFSVKGDQLKDFSPDVSTLDERLPSPAVHELCSEGEEEVKNPLEDVKAGLLDSSGQQVPLQAVHVKCKLMDLLSQVVIFQEYTNHRLEAIEAKFVFPLSDSAAVCGFEAFINGKHVVGQVKEKETARKEYRKAVERGHGAYLMDQDAPDVFTISVGNLPPGATVLVKVTFVSELIVRDGSVLFSLPGSVAPWQESAALNQTTQVTLEKVRVSEEAAASREFTLDASVQMPYEISSLTCLTHSVKTKRTDCNAVVSVLPGQNLGPEGFQLSISLSKVHLPRMWVEKHPDKDSQACMLVFYPDFDIDSGPPSSHEVVLLLDTSESMRDNIPRVQELALRVLKALHPDVKVNVVLFGTEHCEAFLAARPLAAALQDLQEFVKCLTPVGGSTELWRPLRALSLLPPSRGLRNLLLLSDGHIQNAELTLQLLRDGVQHSRLFACGLSPTANRHMLRALAQAGGGAYEFFELTSQHTWAGKVASQVKRMAAPGCSSVSVKWQQFNPTAPPPVQAPKQLQALFSDCHTLVYGFVPHCSQATLCGNLSGKELQTMVSTSELQKTSGTFLHKLTARAVIKDYEDGNLDADGAQHEGKKAELKEFIISLSKEFSVLSQFTSFVAIEERGSEQDEGFTDVPKLVAEEDVDFLPYIGWSSSQPGEGEEVGEEEEEEELGYRALMFEEEECGLSLMDLDQVALQRAAGHLSVDDLSSASDFDGSEHWEDSSFSDRAPCPSPPLVECSVPRDTQHLISDFSFAPPPPLPKSISAGLLVPPLLPQSSLFSGQSSVAPPLTGAPPCNSSQRLSHFGSPLVSLFDALQSSGGVPPPPPPVDRPMAYFKTKFISASPHPSPLLPQSSFGFGQSSVDPPLLGASLCNASPPLSHFQSARVSLSHAPQSSGVAPPRPPPSPPRYRLGSRARMDSVFFKAVLPPMVASTSMAALLPGVSPPPPVATPMVASPPVAALLPGVSPPPPPPPPPPPVADDMIASPPMAALLPGVSPPPPPPPFPPVAPPMVAFPPMVAPTPMAALLASVPPLPPPPPAASDGIIQPRLLRRRIYQGAGVRARTKSSIWKSQADPVLPDFVQWEACADRPASPEEVDWDEIFRMQHLDGYWEFTPELGKLLNLNADLFANVFLKSKGIDSLGTKARADILRLLATLLVLQLMREAKLEEGRLLRTLFCLLQSSQQRSERWQQVRRAVDWVCWADRQYPCICSRLEFGRSWESSTRQLLGFEEAHHSSPLTQLRLRLRPVPLLVL